MDREIGLHQKTRLTVAGRMAARHPALVNDSRAQVQIDAENRSAKLDVSTARIGVPSSRADYSVTPDRRYYVVRGRLWRLSNPFLDEKTRARLVNELMTAKRSVRDNKDPLKRITARLQVDAAKRALGERGAVWWTDGAPDYHRQFAGETPYADWFVNA